MDIQQREVMNQVSLLNPGEELRIEVPHGINMQTARAQVFRMFQGWEHRREIMIKTDMVSRVLKVQRKPPGLKVGAISSVASSGMPTLAPASGTLTDKDILSQAYQLMMSRAPEVVHTYLVKMIGLPLVDALAELGTPQEIWNNPAMCQALFLYLYQSEPWLKVGRIVSTNEKPKRNDRSLDPESVFSVLDELPGDGIEEDLFVSQLTQAKANLRLGEDEQEFTNPEEKETS